MVCVNKFHSSDLCPSDSRIALYGVQGQIPLADVRIVIGSVNSIYGTYDRVSPVIVVTAETELTLPYKDFSVGRDLRRSFTKDILAVRS